MHRRIYTISFEWINNIKNEFKTLTVDQMETVDVVMDYYGEIPNQQLYDMVHNEDPWIQVRDGLLVCERGNREITYKMMFDYYRVL
jgi:uncharacterized phage-associated protein